MTQEERYVLDAAIPDDDPTAEALHKWFGRRSFTRQEVISHITDLSEDAEYAKWEFDQLLEAGCIINYAERTAQLGGMPNDVYERIKAQHVKDTFSK